MAAKVNVNRRATGRIRAGEHERRVQHRSQLNKTNSLAVIPMAGAVLVGTFIGGPVGFLAGIKIGAFAGLGGSLLGYSTANLVEEHLYESLRLHFDIIAFSFF